MTEPKITPRARFVQIACTYTAVTEDDSIYALDETGDVWVYDWKERKWGMIRRDREETS